MRTKYLTAAGLLATSSLGMAVLQTGTASATGDSCQTSAAGTLCFTVDGASTHINTVSASFTASTSMKGYIKMAGPAGMTPFAIDAKGPLKSYNTGTIQAEAFAVNADVPAGSYCAGFYRLQNNAYTLTNLTCVPVYVP